MGLPKIKSPTFTLQLPSNNQKIVYRPFQVKEEKMLLMAQKSDNEEDQIRTVKQIIQNCIIEPSDFDIEQMASFDIEYFFLKLRAKSVGEIVQLKVIPQKRENLPPMEVEIDLDELQPYRDPEHTNVIKMDDSISVQMQYPTFEMITKLKNPDDIDTLFELFRKSMVSIIDGDEVYEITDYSKEEVIEFLESLSDDQLRKLQNFFVTMPKIRKEIEYKWTNPEDENDTHEETVVLQGLLSFLS